MDLRNSRVLVTGGAGLVGSHIVDQLVTEGAQVTVYDLMTRGTRENLEPALAKGGVRLIEGAICDRVELGKAMAGHDFVFHEAAAWKHVCHEDPRVALDLNVGGTLNVLEACLHAKVRKVIAASSASVYGNSDYFPTDEKHPFNTDFFYGLEGLLPEIQIGAGALIGAGAVVTKDVTPDAVVAGNPARIMKYVSDLRYRDQSAGIPY